MLKKKTIEEAFKDPTSLLHWLPWYDCDEGIFLLIDGSVGKIWEVDQVPSNLKSDLELETLSKAIETLLVSLPENTTCQVILLTDERIDSLLDEYQKKTKVKEGHALTVMQGKIDYFKEHRKKLFDYQGYAYSPKRIRLFFTFRYFPSWLKVSPLDKIMQYFTKTHPIKSKFDAYYHSEVKPYMKKIEETIKEGFKRIGTEYQEINAQGLIDVVFPLLNPKRYQNFNLTVPAYNSEIPIREQVIFNHPEASGYGWDFEGIKTGVVSIDTLPSFTSPGMFTLEMPNRLPVTDIIPNLAIIINIYKPDQLKEEGAINKIKMMASIRRGGAMGTGSEANIAKAQDASEAIRQRYTENVSILRAHIHFLTWAEDQDRLERSIDNINNFLHYTGCEGVKENFIGPVLYLQCLPLNFSHLAPPLNFTSRGRRTLSNNLADMLPFYGDYRGGRKPAQIYLNRRGEMVFFDVFESPSNPHFIIAGVSGAGKSFLTNDFIMSELRQESHFYILDKGDSYKKLSSLVGGQYVVFDPDDPICMNPFVEKELTSERQSFLKTLLSEMASGGDPKWATNREEEGCLDTAIRTAYERHTGEEEITLSEVTQVIRESGKIGEKIVNKMRPFLKGGSYGGFMDGQNQFDFKKTFVVFELARLSAKKDLQVVMLMNIMYFISNQISPPELRGVRKFVPIDEAWSLLKTANTAIFLEEAARTYRKCGCALGTITQQTGELVETPAGKALLANSPNRILLMQTREIVAAIQKDLMLSNIEAGMLTTVTKAPGKFSEALIKTETSSGIIRFVADPVSYWVYTTHPPETSYLEKKKEALQGDIYKAILEAAKEYPHGLPL